MIILIHTSKTMRPVIDQFDDSLTAPVLIDNAIELSDYMKSLSRQEIARVMHISESLAETTKALIAGWNVDRTHQRSTLDSFLGDIYSGLQVATWSKSDHDYAQDHLRILSGLYGILRPSDGIYPYRLEMGYRLPDSRYANLYAYWGESIVRELPQNDMIVDLTAVEYGKTVTKYIESERIITPRFLSVSPKIGEPVFIVVHAKIARGAFASWMIRNKVDRRDQLKKFNELGYHYDEVRSTESVPVFVCMKFGGIGLSVRLSS